MPTKKSFPYKLKKIIPMAMLALTPAAFMSCDKDEPLIMHDTTYTFNSDTGEEFTLDQIKASADSGSVKTIYLQPLGRRTSYTQTNINEMRNNYLQPALDVSPKVRGKGNFEFVPGRALVADSLWYVANGWTINQHQK
jgi:hypothetical protein